jgi:hypothetical protein
MGRPDAYVDPTVDELRDSRIEKSSQFQINGSIEEIMLTPSAQMMARIGASQIVKEYLLEIPNGVPPERIITLSDVSKLGGSIVSSAAFNLKGRGNIGREPTVEQ